jgi:hypothetical protein
MQTFAARLDLAYSVESEGELTRLLADLPARARLSRAVLRAVSSVSRWTQQIAEAWQEPRTRRLSLTTSDEVMIGRSRLCDCVISDADVSRHHARLRHGDGTWWLSDLGSANGTYVNEWRLSRELEVRPGDRVSFGDARFVLAAPLGSPHRRST